jgi:hypothetical protein
MSGRPLRRVVIKEELVALTGDAIRAILLNQLLYWQARVRDYDRFLLEELKRRSHGESENPNETTLSNGWIYKSAEELGEEVMLGLSKQSILRRLEELVAAGWLHRRRNPKHAWDRTLQYRCDLQRIHADLLAIGYHLDGWVLDLLEPSPTAIPETAENPTNSNLEHRGSSVEERVPKMEPRRSTLESQGAKREPRAAATEPRRSTVEMQYQRALQRSSPKGEAESLPAPLEMVDSETEVRRLLENKRALGPLLATLVGEDPLRAGWFRLPPVRIEAILREGRRLAKERGVSPATAIKGLLDAALAAGPEFHHPPAPPEEASGVRRAMAAAEAEADARVEPLAMARLLARLPLAAQRSTLANLPSEMRERVLSHLRASDSQTGEQRTLE